MTPDELKGRLGLIGVSCRVRQHEVIIETCRFCDNEKWNLELNPGRGLFHCWACDAGGRLDSLLQDWLNAPGLFLPVDGKRDAPAVAAAPTEFKSTPAYDLPLVARYLTNRGIGASVAAQYNFVVCNSPEHLLYTRVVTPILDFWSGVVIGYVGRAYVAHRTKYLNTLSSRQVVTGYRVRSRRAPCLLVEGFFDGIAVHRAGYNVAVLGGTNAPWLKYFADRLPPDVPVIVLLDSEAHSEAQRLRWTLQAHRPNSAVHVISLPSSFDPAMFVPAALARYLDSTVPK